MRRRNGRWPRRLLVVAFLMTAGVGWAIYALRVSEIRVAGANTLPPSDIIEASGLRGGERILWTQMSRIARRVEGVPGVARARVDRSLPGTVVIGVTERSPIVRLDRRPALVADADGVVFPFDQRYALPVLVGWRGGARAGGRIDQLSRIVLHSMADFPSALSERAQRVEVGRSVTVFLADGTEIRFGSPTDLGAKARAAQVVLDAAAARGEELAYVDVRAPNAPASLKRGAPAPSPAAGSAPGQPR